MDPEKNPDYLRAKLDNIRYAAQRIVELIDDIDRCNLDAATLGVDIDIIEDDADDITVSVANIKHMMTNS